ncbi:MAG: YbcC family protein [Flavobacteriales bacterium]
MNDNKGWTHVRHVLEHYLPSQAPLKDFIHHNTLHAFQGLPFHRGLEAAQALFGYQTYAPLDFYRERYHNGQISEAILDRLLEKTQQNGLKEAMINTDFDQTSTPIVGSLRSEWKIKLGFDLDTRVHPILFRIISSFIDQGIAIWSFPSDNLSFLAALRSLEKESIGSLFSTKRARSLFLDPDTTLDECLHILTGSEIFYESYILDQQFAHPGYAGMVLQLEKNPTGLIQKRSIRLEDVILLECLLEIDALDQHFQQRWLTPEKLGLKPYVFDPKQVSSSTLFKIKALWQEAYEWTYYDQVLAALKLKSHQAPQKVQTQAIFCIDDRECSIRRHIETLHPSFASFGTPGHFNIETYFQPEGASQITKICPAPVQPKHLIQEKSVQVERNTELHFSAQTYGLVVGWILTHTYGLWSALKLALAIFKPSMNKMAVSSSQHMQANSVLSILHENQFTAEGLQVGFRVEEMTRIVGSLLRSIGLTSDFSPLIYMVAHGSSSANNTHYAGYDCGACSGRPGSVNARAFSYMANHPLVRQALRLEHIDIPDQTHFVPVLHDTCRDEFNYYDLDQVPVSCIAQLSSDRAVFNSALEANAVERSRRFITINSHQTQLKLHRSVKLRSVSLFEPRPELNHANNALCIVGRRSFSRDLFLDRRAFLNSYDCSQDPKGQALEGILNAVAPVCGGINLEYYFSRVDNQQLGAGTKLPHNVLGLIGVANGIDGDLRTGIPSQMIEVHDPYRLLVIVEQDPAIVLQTIQRNPATFEWFNNEWIRLVAAHPTEQQFYVLENAQFVPYELIEHTLPKVGDIMQAIAGSAANFPIVELQQKAS